MPTFFIFITSYTFNKQPCNVESLIKTCGSFHQVQPVTYVSQYQERPPSSETEEPKNKHSCQWLVILLCMLEVTDLKLSPENSS